MSDDVLKDWPSVITPETLSKNSTRTDEEIQKDIEEAETEIKERQYWLDLTFLSTMPGPYKARLDHQRDVQENEKKFVIFLRALLAARREARQ